jgi:hypothetical protein
MKPQVQRWNIIWAFDSLSRGMDICQEFSQEAKNLLGIKFFLGVSGIIPEFQEFWKKKFFLGIFRIFRNF